ncbi:MAG: insulinase family protein, partial [Deltaproteobacteria bacterium]|nr:insulinase family protein [Deltaproteobacteria bacterium]
MPVYRDFLVLAAITALSCSPKQVSVAPPAPPEAPPEVVEPFIGGLQVHTFVLDNGLTLKVVPDHAAPVVAYQTWIGVGSADEVEGKTGLAHLFEHLMFKGTDGYEDGEFDAQMTALGAEGLNAWTWLDQTVYIEAAPTTALDTVAGLEALRLDGLILDEETFTSEREVVINERRLGVDNSPEGKLDEMVMAEAFTHHPYGWPTLGWMEDLEGMTLEDAQAFYRKWYAPDNATVILVGDVDPAAARAVVERHYGSLRPSGVERHPRPEEPVQAAQRRVEDTFPMSSDLLMVAFKLPPFTHQDIPALLVLDEILTGGQTGRLQRGVRDGGYAAEISAFVYPFRDPSVYTVSLKSRPGVPAAAVEEALWAELARVREAGVSDGELAMGISQWQLYNATQLEEASGKANFLGWSLTHTGSHLDGLKQIEAIDRVTAEDVQRVAGQYLLPERSTVGVLKADEPGEVVATEAHEPVEPVARVEVASRALEGPPDAAPGALVEVASKGATLLLAHDATVPVVHFRLRFSTGSAADPQGREGLANLTGRMLLRGTKTHDRTRFEAAFEQLGATAEVEVSADGIMLTGSCLSTSWPTMVELLTEAVAEPAFDPTQVDQLRDEVRNELIGVRDSDYQLANLAVRRFLYGAEHPYGRDARGTLATLDALQPADLTDFHTRYLRSGGALIGLAGAFDAGAVDDLRAMLDLIEGDPAPVAEVPLPLAPEGRTVVLVDKPDLTQAQVRMGQLGLDQRAGDFPAF